MLSNFYQVNLDKKEESKKNLTEKFINILGKVVACQLHLPYILPLETYFHSFIILFRLI